MNLIENYSPKTARSTPSRRIKPERYRYLDPHFDVGTEFASTLLNDWSGEVIRCENLVLSEAGAYAKEEEIWPHQNLRELAHPINDDPYPLNRSVFASDYLWGGYITSSVVPEQHVFVSASGNYVVQRIHDCDLFADWMSVLPALSAAQPRLSEELEEIRNLSDGWNGKNSVAVEQSNIESAQRLLDLLSATSSEKPSIGPLNDGGLSLTWEQDDRELWIYVKGGQFEGHRWESSDQVVGEVDTFASEDRALELLAWLRR